MQKCHIDNPVKCLTILEKAPKRALTRVAVLRAFCSSTGEISRKDAEKRLARGMLYHSDMTTMRFETLPPTLNARVRRIRAAHRVGLPISTLPPLPSTNEVVAQSIKGGTFSIDFSGVSR